MINTTRGRLFEQALHDLKDDVFSVVDMRDRIFGLLKYNGETDIDKSHLRRWVYSKLLPLIKRGDLIEKVNEDGKKVYSRHKDGSETDVSSGATQTMLNQPFAQKHNSSSLLKERLRQHRSGMLRALARVSECEVLCEQSPAIQEAIQSLYDEAREESTTLLAKIELIEELLNEHGKGFVQ